MNNNLHFKFTDPLNEYDTEIQTYGCRATDPNICGNNGLMGVCAFVCSDCICRKPSRLWKKQYHNLLGEKNDIK